MIRHLAVLLLSSLEAKPNIIYILADDLGYGVAAQHSEIAAEMSQLMQSSHTPNER